MSEPRFEAKGPAPVMIPVPEGSASAPGLATIPAKDVTPEDAPSLALEYRDGVAVLTLRGDAIPVGIQLVDADGRLVAGYAVNVIRPEKTAGDTLVPVTIVPKASSGYALDGSRSLSMEFDWEFPGTQGCGGGANDPCKFVVEH